MQDYSQELSKLNRASGQLEGIKEMIKDQRQATEIIIQLKAARAAIKSVETSILQDHMNNYLLSAQDQTELKQKIEELAKLYKKSEF
ncbi:MAG: metal-sensitive transcriptional regulator [Candidatus Melainabacteria bacterium]|nr:metal-sensitive transcriptional regulator [Candidatus Melainabacteria bacterium]